MLDPKPALGAVVAPADTPCLWRFECERPAAWLLPHPKGGTMGACAADAAPWLEWAPNAQQALRQVLRSDGTFGKPDPPEPDCMCPDEFLKRKRAVPYCPLHGTARFRGQNLAAEDAPTWSPKRGRALGWQDLARVLAERLAHHAVCGDHPQATPMSGCGFCEDRAVYQMWLAKAGKARTRRAIAHPLAPGNDEVFDAIADAVSAYENPAEDPHGRSDS